MYPKLRARRPTVEFRIDFHEKNVYNTTYLLYVSINIFENYQISSSLPILYNTVFLMAVGLERKK